MTGLPLSNKSISVEVDLESLLEDESTPCDERYEDSEELKIKAGLLREAIKVINEQRSYITKLEVRVRYG